jgi:hypothetical protein
VLRNITLPDGRVSPKDKERLEAFFQESRWKHLLLNTKEELTKAGDVVFPVRVWARLDSELEKKQQALINAGAAHLAVAAAAEEEEDSRSRP